MKYKIAGFPKGTRIQLTEDLHVCKSDLVLKKGSMGWIVDEPYSDCTGTTHPPLVMLDEIGGIYSTRYITRVT